MNDLVKVPVDTQNGKSIFSNKAEDSWGNSKSIRQYNHSTIVHIV